MLDQSISLDQSSTPAPPRRLSFASTRDLIERVRTQNSVRSKHSYTHEEQDLFSPTALADVPKILPYFSHTVNHSQCKVDMVWYSWWIGRQVASTPQNLLALLPARDELETVQAFLQLWHGLGVFLSENACSKIDDILQHLVEIDLIERQKDTESIRLAKSLIFTMIGWQTMLYRSDCGSCPPTFFAIADEMSGHKGRVRMKLQHPQTSSREPLDKCLLGFGVLLPPKNYDLSESPEHRKAFKEFKDVDASRLNASLLVHVGRLELRWTDCLACHLELDLMAGCFYLFRYP